MSEFGAGLTYCLGLFLVHSMQDYYLPDELKKNREVEMYFYGASDHLFELSVDEAPKHLKQRFKEFRDKCLKWRLPMNTEDKPTEKDKEWAINEAKDLLIEIDKHLGIETEKGDWE